VRLDREPVHGCTCERLGRGRMTFELDRRDAVWREHDAAFAAMADHDRGELGALIGSRFGRGIGPRAIVDATDNHDTICDELGRSFGHRRHEHHQHERTHGDQTYRPSMRLRE